MKSAPFSQLFVYSSLLEGFHNQSYNYISHYFTLVCKAKVKGMVSNVGGRRVCTPTLDNIFTNGELYKLNDEKYFSWAFGQLDDYEWPSANKCDMQLYLRNLTIVYKEDGSKDTAWIYWYNGGIPGMPRTDSIEVLEYLNAIKM
jgi:hypothetical protein